MIVRLCDSNAIVFIQLMKENGIWYEELEDENYLEVCPNCNDSEFWHYGRCGHCGYEV